MTAVLIVDDSAALRTQVSATLTAAGFEVLEAADGVEALKTVKTVAGIGLVIIDLHMPRMDGFQLLAALREMGPNMPRAVIITTEARIEFVEKGKRAGAKGWLVKPFKAEHLVAVARRLTIPGLSVTGPLTAIPPLSARAAVK
jgi:two-component system chemotaxis response regulator CheY